MSSVIMNKNLVEIILIECVILLSNTYFNVILS